MYEKICGSIRYFYSFFVHSWKKFNYLLTNDKISEGDNQKSSAILFAAEARKKLEISGMLMHNKSSSRQYSLTQNFDEWYSRKFNTTGPHYNETTYLISFHLWKLLVFLTISHWACSIRQCFSPLHTCALRNFKPRECKGSGHIVQIYNFCPKFSI